MAHTSTGTGSGKKFVWTREKMTQALYELINRHDEFLRKKKVNRHFDVYGDVAEIVGGSGQQLIKDLLKNLGRDYRAVQTKMSASGAETEELELRNSHILYLAYEEFYSTYFPVGGAVKPDIIVTPSQVHKLGQPSKRALDHEDSHEADGEMTGPSRPPSPCPSTMSTRPARASSPTCVSKAKKSKDMKEEDFLTNSASFQQTYLDLVREQNKTLKTIADNMELQNKTLERIADDLKLLKGGYFVKNGLTTRVVGSIPMMSHDHDDVLGKQPDQ